jgi:mono/diheme cytochrome c family protein
MEPNKMNKQILAAGIIMMIISSVSATAQVKKTVKPAAVNITASMARGKILFKNICATCHQADGSGVPRMNPPLIKTTYVLGDKTKLIKVLLLGLNEDVEIEGEYYSNPMPAQAALKDEEIADVLTFVRNSFGNKAAAITPAQVKAVRATIK